MLPLRTLLLLSLLLPTFSFFISPPATRQSFILPSDSPPPAKRGRPKKNIAPTEPPPPETPLHDEFSSWAEQNAFDITSEMDTWEMKEMSVEKERKERGVLMIVTCGECFGIEKGVEIRRIIGDD